MDYEITDYITPEEYMEMRKLVGWTDFPMEQAEQGSSIQRIFVFSERTEKLLHLQESSPITVMLFILQM